MKSEKEGKIQTDKYSACRAYRGTFRNLTESSGNVTRSPKLETVKALYDFFEDKATMKIVKYSPENETRTLRLAEPAIAHSTNPDYSFIAEPASDYEVKPLYISSLYNNESGSTFMEQSRA